MKATRATPWSRSRRNVIGQPVTGSVHATGGGVYTVRLDDGRAIGASLRGRLKRARGPVVIGDRVVVSNEGGAWTVESVEPRVTELVRHGLGGKSPKVLAANLDRVFAVLALVDPRATMGLIDRMLVSIEASGIHPLLVLNKVDLAGAREIADVYRMLYEATGYRAITVSAATGEGLEPLRELLSDGVSALIGPSGAGKSSILNALSPGLALRTGALSGKTGTGRHTTVSSRLIELDCGGFVADTPGFGNVSLWGAPAENVPHCFPEFSNPATECRFRRCTHMHEPDCGVRVAVAEGRIHGSRYESYVRIRTEVAEAS